MFNKIKSLFKKSEPTVEAVVHIEPTVSQPDPPPPPPPPLPPPPQLPKKPRKPRQKKVKVPEPELSPKELATKNGEPYINVIALEVDSNDIHKGSFIFDYNDKFILNLIKNGYKLKPTDTDELLVDRWFNTVCRNVALEMYEQEIADPYKRELDSLMVIRSKQLGNGRSEIS
jgi:hypothetical protein